MKYIIVLLSFLLTSCSQMNPNDPLDGGHGYVSKYERYMQQCDEWDYEICLQRYNEIVMKKRRKKINRKSPVRH